MADPETISYQTQQVTTEVFPSEMGEGEIPWWVWLLAALLGLLLLAIITLCLYKVSTIYTLWKYQLWIFQGKKNYISQVHRAHTIDCVSSKLTSVS